ncbi:sugar nucleotide-binding protein [Subsaximicrobium wynnwilliamsii]|uniref:dTDP-4-dehydrorhamnose reductase n=1 Tax=Subsaximicrobium wynnwilliamsii TaxID=291179 RepID=A0A5C6ZND8_9FLAO|nr:sugar nucleotide-binding protein [Subsaximicrobium wynnwilliamsii]TXD84842.1 sugar nucleotide-binding protein [Subsaximicrobium wynnwilliamsii]TXD90513.1 sugar nucleotide-binding protein [Subsaximicrobium wynnwilliamsii]TXE04988.1 sugar nucleotide-binding protein [Subsaximicrobium wynnwilliamsii]
MSTFDNKHRILILGASGFLGNAIYRELCAYFKTFGTYRVAKKSFEDNRQFFQYNVEEDDVYELLETTKPSIIISCLRGDFHAQVMAHQHIGEYLMRHECKIIFLSSANVFDAYSKYPSYELDKTFSGSIYGHFKIKIENMLLRLPKKKVAIVRLPMVLGAQSPRLKELKQHLEDKTAIEVFPNIIMNVTTDSKVTQQIHYIINRDETGIFHLGSTDLVHHDEYFKDIVNQMAQSNGVIYKQVYTTNEDRYLAVLPKYNKLPKHLQVTSDQVLADLNK